jgi:rSAM/selenodomain-associated transferase 1
MTQTRANAVLAAAGAVLTGAVALWARQGDATGRVAPHLLVYGAAFAAYLAALVVAPRLSRPALLAALFAALAWRAALVAAPPLLSDDVFRYVWEGRIQRLGGNPYAWNDRPASARWAGMRDAVWQGINHKEYSTLYPPFWEWAARGVASVHDSVRAMKVFLVLCELVAIAALLRLLDRRGLPRGRLLVLAWSPLALVEIAGSGHNDALGLALVALSLLALESGRGALSALALTLGFLTKLLPGFLALAWFRRYSWRHAALALGVVIVVTLPYVSAGPGLLLGLRQYGAHWRFNESLFALWAPLFAHQTAALRAGALLLAALALALGRRRVEPAAAGLAVVAGALLLSANVLPWYALWLLPFLVLRDCPPALLYTGTAAFAYLVYPPWQSGERWAVGWDVRALEYLPCLLVAAVWARRRKVGDVLLVFVKAPRPGFVKTRLAERLGADLAADVYRALVARVRAATAPRAHEYARVFCYSDFPTREEAASWLDGEAVRPQEGADLGARMSAAFARAFAEGASRVVLVGSDAPDLERRHVVEALQALGGDDLALAPSGDGGYSLVALRRPCPEIFSGIPWSTPAVLRETVARAEAAGLRVAMLETLADIDTPADLARASSRLHVWLPPPLLEAVRAACGDTISGRERP